MSDHRIQRAQERYGITLAKPDLRAIERQIASGQSVRIWQHANQTSRHLVRHGETVMVCVWGPNPYGGRQLITFLPPDCIKAGEHARRNSRRNSKR